MAPLSELIAGMCFVCAGQTTLADMPSSGPSMFADTSAVVRTTYDALSLSPRPSHKPARQKRGKAQRFDVDLAWLPGSIPVRKATGVSAYYHPSRKWSLGVDYYSGSIALSVFSWEFGSIDERHISFQARRWFGRSFNLLMGMGSRSLEVRLPGSWFDLVTHTYSQTLSRIESTYVRLGLANQWRLGKRMALNVDWLTLNIPLGGGVPNSASEFAATPTDADRIRSAESWLRFYPSGTVLRLAVGLVF